ncbi:RNA polymerase II C-terminal domain phosphatase-like 4 [Selaginella moellendorffii]|uniref:RNA polymerase II C-terminal domain phosphatase-like 4 n=1 Tax=Selaginella moellendorffii TaxID=88036 RepID=UPI000D1CE810|nr:RNA polymerase II C-terminal domain phosphatase-like 4 [Selaginella moellendorffii]|eukprot:XP_024516756.1 RNA polymerase II C-terminal domain phosphatase-like 4 [Selaginella moellendorffii]
MGSLVSKEEDCLKKRKLILVLSLDHTLLNSAAFNEVDKEESKYLEFLYAQQNEGQRKLLHKGFKKWTKIRPFALEFLNHASKIFELYICTTGSHKYAMAMTKLLDPTGKLFKGRVFSRLEGQGKPKKYLENVVPRKESITLIVDDSRSAWPKDRQNLIRVTNRYHFFKSSCRKRGLPETGCCTFWRMDESENFGSLTNVLQGLKRIHSEFFRDNLLPRDVRDVCKVRGLAFMDASFVLSIGSRKRG